MPNQEKPKCKHCDAHMKKWQPPADSTWSTAFLWVCFNDECSYFKRGWDHMMKTQEAKASYRHTLNPETETTGPLPCWSYDAQKDRIIGE